MAKTPEGEVKKKVRDALHSCGVFPFMEVGLGKHTEATGTYYMPVAGPFAVHGVHDFVGCWSGRFFSIETKAPNNSSDETPHQGYFRVAISLTGGISLTGVRDGQKAVDHIKQLVGEG